MMEYVLGIDIGTSSCKVALVDTSGIVVAAGSAGYAVEADGSMDPMKWWRSAILGIRHCFAESGVLREQIVAVGCTGQMQGCTFIGSTGRPSRNSLLWCDSSAAPQAHRLNEEHGDLLLREAGQISTAALMVSKIRWTVENDPKSWAATTKVMFASNFITFMLTGEVTTDPNNAGFSGLSSVDGSGWSGELVEATGIQLHRLPEVTEGTRVIGTVTPQAAEATGLHSGTKVINGTGDVAAECFSVAVNGLNEVKLRLGSAAAANMVVPRAMIESAGHALPYLDLNYAVIGGYVARCGLALRWARDAFFSELGKAPDAHSVMDREAAASPLGANGSRYEAGRDQLVGNAHLSRGDVVRACYEGTSFAVRAMIQRDVMLSGAGHVLLCGGGASSSLWTSCLASILGMDLRVPKYADAAFGVALIAGASIGVMDARAAAGRSRSAGRTVRFDRDARDAYEPLYTAYSTRPGARS